MQRLKPGSFTRKILFLMTISQFIVVIFYSGVALAERQWQRVRGGFPTQNAIWGNGPGNVFSVGGASILHFDGYSWSPIHGIFAHPLYGIWGASATEIFVVGDNASILHFNGIEWTQMETGIRDHLCLYAIWGFSFNNIFAVGSNGRVLHFNGSSWNIFNNGVQRYSSVDIKGIWGSSPYDLFIVSQGGLILHYDGQSWNQMNSATDNYLYITQGSK